MHAQVRDIDEVPPQPRTITSTTAIPPTETTSITTHRPPPQPSSSRHRSTSADVLLRSLELRESVEKELLHSVEKLVKLRHRGDAQQFRLHVARLKAQEQQIDDLQQRVNQKDEDVHSLRRQLSNLEQKCAAQTVQLMTVKTELHSSNVEISTDRARQLKLKDDEIQALNAHLGEVEIALHGSQLDKEAREKALATMQEQHQVVQHELNVVNTNYEKKTEQFLNEIEHLKARVNHADAYRSESTRQMSTAEDEAAVQAHTQLKMKATIAKLDVTITEQKQHIGLLQQQVAEANDNLKLAMDRSKTYQTKKEQDRQEVEQLRAELIKLSEDSIDVSSERMLDDARTQITSLQAILAETHQHSQEAEKRLHASEKKGADKDAKMRAMRSEMDEHASESEERIRRLENNIRVLCQNIENSNSILTMKKKTQAPPKGASGEEELYDDRTIGEEGMGYLCVGGGGGGGVLLLLCCCVVVSLLCCCVVVLCVQYIFCLCV